MQRLYKHGIKPHNNPMIVIIIIILQIRKLRDYKIYPRNQELRPALAGVAQWIEYWLANQRAIGLIPSQDTCLGCGPRPQWGLRKRQSHIDVSLPLSHCLSKNKYIKS